MGFGLPEALIGGAVIGGLGNFFGAKEDSKAQKAANEANLQSAREQMVFQREMSNTAYQRGMQDMEKAGLNPMLAFSQGGASSPSGAMATSQPASQGYGRAMSKTAQEGINTAAQYNQMTNQTAQTQSNIGLQTTASAKNVADAKASELNAINTEARTKETLQNTKQGKSKFELEQKMRETDQKYQEAEKWLDMFTKGAGAIKPSFNFGGNSGKNPPSVPRSGHSGKSSPEAMKSYEDYTGGTLDKINPHGF